MEPGFCRRCKRGVQPTIRPPRGIPRVPTRGINTLECTTEAMLQILESKVFYYLLRVQRVTLHFGDDMIGGLPNVHVSDLVQYI